jgi:hypothetical protein
MSGAIPPLHQYVHGVVLIEKHRDNFTVTVLKRILASDLLT